MHILKVLLMLIEILSCFLLVAVILIQRSKSEGMGGLAAGAGMGEQLFGSRAGNVLTRTTVILACVFMGNTTLIAVTYAAGTQKQSVIEQKAASAAKSSQPITGPQAAPAPVVPAAPIQPLSPEATPAPAPAPAAIPVESPAPAPAAPVVAE